MAKQEDANLEGPPAGEAPRAEQKAICGIVMPISAMPPIYSAEHWVEVREVIEEAIVSADLRPQMVSDSFDSDVIQQRIIANIFNNPVVVCDVSGLNANVMFELGMRLASKKATIVLTDDFASLPFDTRIIDHLSYARGLPLKQTRVFIEALAGRIREAYSKVVENAYKPFLENFTGVEAETASIANVSETTYIRSRLDRIDAQLSRLSSFATDQGVPWPGARVKSTPALSKSFRFDQLVASGELRRLDFDVTRFTEERVANMMTLIGDLVGVRRAEITRARSYTMLTVYVEVDAEEAIKRRVEHLLSFDPSAE